MPSHLDRSQVPQPSPLKAGVRLLFVPFSLGVFVTWGPRSSEITPRVDEATACSQACTCSGSPRASRHSLSPSVALSQRGERKQQPPDQLSCFLSRERGLGGDRPTWGILRESGLGSRAPGGMRWSPSGPGLKLGVGGKAGRAVRRGAGSMFKGSEASPDWDEEAEPGSG